MYMYVHQMEMYRTIKLNVADFQTCFKNSSRAISPWAMRMMSRTMGSCLMRSTSHTWPRVRSDSTQRTFSFLVSCFQCLSFRASDFNSTISTFICTGTNKINNNPFLHWSRNEKVPHVNLQLPLQILARSSLRSHMKHSFWVGMGVPLTGSASRLKTVLSISQKSLHARPKHVIHKIVRSKKCLVHVIIQRGTA